MGWIGGMGWIGMGWIGGMGRIGGMGGKESFPPVLPLPPP